jgi:uncharacterized membrane protein
MADKSESPGNQKHSFYFTCAPDLDFRLLCVFAYLFAFVSAVLIIVLEKDSEDLRFHGWQSLIWFGLWFVVMIICIILDAIFNFIIISLIWWAIGFVVWVVCMVFAYLWAGKGDRFLLPLLGTWAASLAAKNSEDDE